MKIHILFKFKESASGGGNQFLKALRNYFISIDSYTDTPQDADVILYNSHQFISELVAVKQQLPDKIFVHRVDGPIRLYNSMNDKRDSITNIANKYIADGTIFQSNWSKERNYEMGLKKNNFETTILNAPDPEIFNRDGKVAFSMNRKIKLIATSWSANMKKGFEVYKWIDENLDFNKYEMTFVGNSPVKFKNIIQKKPMNSKQLAKELKNNDIFITASQKDPCSNSLIEALHCGLPAVGLNDGGHTEIICNSGEVFNQKEEIPELIERIVNNYETYQKNINLPTIDEVGELYFNFLKSIYDKKKSNGYNPKNPTSFDYLKIRSYVVLWNFEEKLYAIKKRIFK